MSDIRITILDFAGHIDSIIALEIVLCCRALGMMDEQMLAAAILRAPPLTRP